MNCACARRVAALYRGTLESDGVTQVRLIDNILSDGGLSGGITTQTLLKEKPRQVRAIATLSRASSLGAASTKVTASMAIAHTIASME